MRTVPARSLASPLLDDAAAVPDELIGRLHRATEGGVLDLVDEFTAQQRAHLAMFCYHKAHLRRKGLAIAATCDLTALVQAWGTVLGHALFAQSRSHGPDVHPARVHHRPKITLAGSAGAHRLPVNEADEISQPA